MAALLRGRRRKVAAVVVLLAAAVLAGVWRSAGSHSKLRVATGIPPVTTTTTTTSTTTSSTSTTTTTAPSTTSRLVTTTTAVDAAPSTSSSYQRPDPGPPPQASIQSYTLTDEHRADPGCNDGTSQRYDVVRLDWSTTGGNNSVLITTGNARLLGSDGTGLPLNGSVEGCAPEGVQAVFRLKVVGYGQTTATEAILFTAGVTCTGTGICFTNPPGSSTTVP